MTQPSNLHSAWSQYKNSFYGKTPLPANARKSLFGLAALSLFIGGSMAYDSFQGSRDNRDVKLHGVKEHAAMGDLEYGFGHWSGMPTFDHWAHKLKRWSLYGGPWDWKIRWNEIKIYHEGVMDALLQGSVPLGIGLVSLYAGLGPDKVNQWFGNTLGSIWGRVTKSTPFKQDMRRMAGKAVTSILKGLSRIGSMPFRSGVSFLVTLGGLLAGSFAVHRFNDSYHHEGQDQFFRSTMHEKEFH